MRMRLLATALMLAGQALAVCPSGYGNYREVVLPARASTLTDFPSMVCFNGSAGTVCDSDDLDFPELKTTANGGKIENTVTGTSPYSRTIPADFIFVDTNGTTILAFEIEKYSATTGELIAFVKKTLTTSTTTIYACYGNASVTTDQSNTTGTWDSGYVAVYHMSESSGTTLNNSTSTASIGLTKSTLGSVAGRVGNGIDFTGGSDKASTSTVAPFQNPSTFTIEFLTKLDTYGGGNIGIFYTKLFSARSSSATSCTQCFWSSGAFSSAAGGWVTGTNTLLTGSWYSLAYSLNTTSASNEPVMYIDGASSSVTEVQAPVGSWNDSSISTVTLGNRDANDRGLDGIIDEFRYSNVIRNAEWIDATHDSLNSPATFFTLGDEGEATPPPAATKGSAPWLICCPKKVPNRATGVDGAWTWYNDPRAVRFGDNTYFGGVTTDGTIRIWQFNHTTSAFSHFNLDAALEQDDHDNPAIIRLSNGKLVAFWNEHVGPGYYKVSSSADSIAAWGSRQTVSAGDYSYAQVYQVANGTIYWFYRGTVFTDWDQHFITTTEANIGSNTWTSPVRMTNNANSHRPYTKYAQIAGTNEIWFAYNPDGDHNSANSMYFAKFDTAAGEFRKMNGDLIGTTASPWNPLNGDKAWDVATHGGSAQVWDFAVDASGTPAMVFVSYEDYPSSTATGHAYWYTRWNGTAWESHRIMDAGGRITTMTDGYTCGIAIDPKNVNVIFTAYNEGPDTDCENLERRVTDDGGATWTITPVVTSGNNMRPFVIPGNTTETWLAWFYGSYTSYLDYTTNIRIQKIP